MAATCSGEYSSSRALALPFTSAIRGAHAMMFSATAQLSGPRRALRSRLIVGGEIPSLVRNWMNSLTKAGETDAAVNGSGILPIAR